jgi:Protein of unknown function (DUF3050)
MTGHPPLDRLHASLRSLRTQVVEHPMYHHLTTLADVRTFMEHHVFAVWDFMSLLKALQRQLTCVTLPWVPQGDPRSRRFINEVVVAEESDAAPGGGYISHFELYHAAMQQCGADTAPIERFVDRVRQGDGVGDALVTAGAPPAAQAFVATTWQIIASGAVHAIAAAFSLGREELIPGMFRALVTDLQHQCPGQCTLFQHYLERHIDLDDAQHTPLALDLLTAVCADDPRKWCEAEVAARLALQARVALWDGVHAQLTRARGQSMAHASGGSPLPT